MRATKGLKDVGDYFIYLSQKAGKKITNKKLQKLVYYAQSWSLVINNKKLFDDPIEAWIHGPAVKSLYRIYKNYGFNPIEKNISSDIAGKFDKKTKELLDEVWIAYGRFDANYLEFLTHSEEPWQKAREGLEDYLQSNNIISDELMKNYYKDLLEKHSIDKKNS